MGHWLTVARAAFLLLAAWFISIGLRDKGDELRAGLEDTPWEGLVASFVLVLIGLVITGFLWRRVLSCFEHDLPVRAAMSIFFFGQLGKYIPGSVWSFGAQAEGGRRFAVPARVTVGASSVFLGIHVATAAVLSAAIGLLPSTRTPIAAGWLVLIGSGGIIAIVPRTVRACASIIAGRAPHIYWREHAELVALMLGAWTAYGLSVIVLRPTASPGEVGALVMAYALAYAAGVIVILAPAGLGAREGVFVMVAGPVVGTGVAAAIALLTRLLSTVADVALALAASALDRRERDHPDR
jgi:uncharacterized membrane protein YbhN (UPF0104 family)